MGPTVYQATEERPQGALCFLGEGRAGGATAAEMDLEIRCVDKEELARCGVCVVGSDLELVDKEGTWPWGRLCQDLPHGLARDSRVETAQLWD